jgi:hypothetical protein
LAAKPALTSKGQRGAGRSEVVLDQTILGLLINGWQRLPWGIKEIRLISGVIRQRTVRLCSAFAEPELEKALLAGD